MKRRDGQPKRKSTKVGHVLSLFPIDTTHLPEANDELLISLYAANKAAANNELAARLRIVIVTDDD